MWLVGLHSDSLVGFEGAEGKDIMFFGGKKEVVGAFVLLFECLFLGYFVVIGVFLGLVIVFDLFFKLQALIVPTKSEEMRLSSVGFTQQTPPEDEKRILNSELWHACAGPLVSLPAVGSRVVYFPQGHSEQVTASTNKVDAHVPNHPSLPPQLICQLHNLTMHADVETDEIYAQMTLQPLNPQERKEALFPSDFGAPSKHPTNYFCKTLTASDTSTHGGFSVPRRAAEKVFPPLDFSLQPPAQELIARDLHGNEWKFRHIFRGQPKRHLLTTGWSVFVSAKRLVAGDTVIFLWNEKNQLLLGIRRANRPQTLMPSSVLSCDSMHLGLLAAAAHAAATNSLFTVFYNPRSSPSEFVIPLAKYMKAVYHTRLSIGMRFRMLFETEESGVRRYMGTITAISDLDPVRWPNSHWRSVKVGWDESTAGERQPRVSLWEIEPLTTFPMYPSSFPLRLKRPRLPGLASFNGMKDDGLGMSSPFMWIRGDSGNPGMQTLDFQGIGIAPWLQPRLDSSMLSLQTGIYQAMAPAALQEVRAMDPSRRTLQPLLQLEQAQSAASRPVGVIPAQILQQSEYQPTFLPSIPESQSQAQSYLQQQLHNQNSFNNQQQHQQQTPSPPSQRQQQLVDPQQVPSVVSMLSQFAAGTNAPPPALQSVSSIQHQSFSDSNGNCATGAVVLPLPRSSPLSAGWPSKQVAVDVIPSGASHCIVPQVEQVTMPFTNHSQGIVSLPPFPGRESSIDQEGSNDPQSQFLFGLNIDSSSLLMQNGVSSLSAVGSASDSTTTPFTSSNYTSATDTDFPSIPAMIPSICIDESGLLRSHGNMGQVKPPNFVKVYKSGSFGRSLDISKFSNYHELRSELALMFGLEGQLEDPLRSGWQLVLVDRENDVLLLGDDPWPDFVKNVWCIKILSPQEVQQMGKRGLELINAGPTGV